MKTEHSIEQKLVPREELPLYGKRVLFTTPRNYAGALGRLLLERGARIVWMPTVEIWPLPDYRELDRAITHLSDYAWIGFTSENGIEAFCARCHALGLDRAAIGTTKLAAFKADAKAFEPWGITADLIPDESSPRGITGELVRRGVKGGRILVPVPEVVGVQEPYVVPEFIRELQHIGMEVHRVPAYMTMAVKEGIDMEKSMLIDGKIDVIVFTSSAEIFSVLNHLGDRRAVLDKLVVAYMGTYTAKTGADLSLRQDVVPQKFTMRGLLEEMEAHFH